MFEFLFFLDEIIVPPTKKRVMKRRSEQDLSVVSKNQVIDAVTRKEGENTGELVVVEKAQDKGSDNLVIGGNNSTTETVTPPLV